MSPMEFICWLDGFTEGRKELSTVDVDLIRVKMTAISPEQVIPYPITPSPSVPISIPNGPTCETAKDLLTDGK